MNKTPDKDGAMWGRPMAACCSTQPAAAGFRDMPVQGTDVAPTSLPEEPPLRFIPGEAAPYSPRQNAPSGNAGSFTTNVTRNSSHMNRGKSTNAVQTVRGTGI